MRLIYPKKLTDYIKSFKYIPRKVKSEEHLKIYHRYWLEDFNEVVKVIDLFLLDGVEYYCIKYNNMNACISGPIPDGTYELLHNKDNIEEKDMINSSESFTGAEIKYWFLYNEIDMSTSSKYSGFWSFLNPESNNLLIDNKYYFVSYNKKHKQKCQIILDKTL